MAEQVGHGPGSYIQVMHPYHHDFDGDHDIFRKQNDPDDLDFNDDDDDDAGGGSDEGIVHCDIFSPPGSWGGLCSSAER